MKATSAANYASVISLLEQRYFIKNIEKRTGLGKSTMDRIKKGMNTDKENHLGGCPSKVFACDKKAILHQIQSGRLDTVVQATHFINSTLPHPVHPQTVRRALEESGLWSATKEKVSMLKKTDCENSWSLL
jgi:transposase